MNAPQSIQFQDLADALKCPNVKESDAPEGLLSRGPLDWREATRADLEEYTLNLLKRMNSPSIHRTEEENLKVWEKGWGENLELLESGTPPAEALTPKYFRPGRFLRYANQLVVSKNLKLEHDLLKICRFCLFQQYLESVPEIYELGCGSGQNVWALSQIYPDKPICGLDWTRSSNRIIETLAARHGRNVSAKRLDMLNPDPDLNITPGSGIVTIHALEQLGSRHHKLIDFMLRSDPSIVVHYEPILEFYDEDDLLDYMALQYSKKRDYLTGFATALRRLAEQGRIEIIADHRPFIGGVVHEASLIVWRPKSAP